MDSITVSFIISDAAAGGADGRLPQWPLELAERGLFCQVVAPGLPPDLAAELERSGVQGVSLPGRNLNTGNYLHLRRALAGFNAKVVVNLDQGAASWGRLAAGRLKIPVIIPCFRQARRSHLERLLSWLNSAVLCDSEELRRFYLANYPADPDRVLDLCAVDGTVGDLLADLIDRLSPRPALGPKAPDLGRGPRPAMSVIIPAFNEAANITTVLGQLAGLRGAYNLELVVSDDGSSDGTREKAGPLCDRVVVPQPGQERGPGAARNRGALAAQADILLFVDADVVLERPEEIISRFLASFTNPAVVSVTCAQNVFPDQAKFSEWAFHTLQTWFMRCEHALGIPVACGGCQAVRRGPFFAVGGYHQWMNMSQDLDLFMRVSRQGRSVYHHDLRVLTTPRRYRETGLLSNVRNILVNSGAVMLFGRGLVRAYHRNHEAVQE